MPAALKRKRRQRTPSLESEIRAKARQIFNDGMAEAMKAAALMIVGRKLDEIRQILGAVGMGQPGMVRSGDRVVLGTGVPGPPIQSPVQHPCKFCGGEGIKRIPKHKWATGESWVCRACLGREVQVEMEDRIDGALLGNQTGPPMVKKPIVATTPPAQMVTQAPPEAPGAATLADAMAALGAGNA